MRALLKTKFTLKTLKDLKYMWWICQKNWAGILFSLIFQSKLSLKNQYAAITAYQWFFTKYLDLAIKLADTVIASNNYTA